MLQVLTPIVKWVDLLTVKELLTLLTVLTVNVYGDFRELSPYHRY